MRTEPAFPRLAIVVLVRLALIAAIPSLATFAAEPVTEEKKDEKTANAEQPAEPDRSASAIVRAARSRASEPEEPVKVYTNDDLQRVWAGSQGSRVEPRASGDASSGERPGRSKADRQPTPDPLRALQQDRERDAEERRLLAEAEAEAVRAAERVRVIEERLRRLRNPLLGRATPPDEPAEEGAADWSELDGAARVRRSEQELLEARETLESKRKAAERLRRPS